MAERYYMNKMFGRGVERARALEQATRDSEQPEALKRVTVEPDEGGGHRVIVERVTLLAGGQRPNEAENNGQSEHSFARPGDTLQFLHDLLTGRAPGEAEAQSEAESGEGGAEEEARA